MMKQPQIEKKAKTHLVSQTKTFVHFQVLDIGSMAPCERVKVSESYRTENEYNTIEIKDGSRCH